MTLSSEILKSTITSKAKELGFFKIGFAKYDVLEKESGYLKKWLDEGKHADMEWISRGFDKRKDVRKILPNARSVISLAFNYFSPFEHDEAKPKISRYAWGKDYHNILKKKLNELSKFIVETSPNPEGIVIKAYVDDGPVMDKVWAQRAGIGWMGKHTNIINPEYGSWFFISEIITNIDFESYDTPIVDMCGSCSLCISACPTSAITDEYQLDSNKCISFHTIENRGEIPPEIDLDGWIFGCDVCQDVCPFNSPKYNHVTDEKGFYPTVTALPLTKGEWPKAEGVDALSSMTEEEFSTVFAGSPIKRTKYSGWKRNLKKFGE